MYTSLLRIIATAVIARTVAGAPGRAVGIFERQAYVFQPFLPSSMALLVLTDIVFDHTSITANRNDLREH
jgi:hypothetical protein